MVGEHFIPFQAATGTLIPIRRRLAGVGLDPRDTERLVIDKPGNFSVGQKFDHSERISMP
jgi:hypothetical protein